MLSYFRPDLQVFKIREILTFLSFGHKCFSVCKFLNRHKSHVCFYHLIKAHSVSVRCEGPDEAHQDGADGHGADEGA